MSLTVAVHHTRPRRTRRRTLLLALLLAGCDQGAPAASDRASRDSAASRSDTTASAGDVAPALTPLPALLRVAPLDDAAREPTLVAMRDTLLAIARRRDTTALARHLDPAVKYSFGENDGRAGFFAHWQQASSLDAMWATLIDVLTHGGRWTTPDLFSAPWTFSALPDSLDAFEHLIVRDSAVPVRLAPEAASAPVGMLSYAVVRASGGPAESAWRAVTLADGRVAYVDTARVRSPVDYRVGLARVKGRWLIQYFVAGD